ncbi:hypothetical protein M433DRAFT_71761 [Acidomyces richmondensis BFW]|nr:MAG: hypothetical protein FE78DRAFT_139986 [Acidomyces sp. 'richmondensis']KYG43394.1 hypothetical protein M433DRAFT_71761 [Acidomyces richmondensis BFW]
MHFRLHSLLFALLIVLVSAVSQQKPVIISYPDDTPSSVLEEAKDVIRKAGGMIEHEYNFIKAFAAKAPLSVLETIRTLESQDKAVIEEDQIVGISGSS